MKRAAIVFCGLMLVGFLSSSASALTFTYDRTNLGSTYGYIQETHPNGLWTTGIWGTAELTDNGNSVDLLIDLIDTGSTPYSLTQLFLNTDLSAGTQIVLSYDATSYTANVTSDSYNPGSRGVLFDLQFGTSSGTLGNEPFTGSLSIVGGGDLDPENFWVASPTQAPYSGTDDFYSFLKIEGVNLWAGPGNAGSGSANIYASTATVPVPEPATMLLLGTGLVCFGVVGRKKLFNHK